MTDPTQTVHIELERLAAEQELRFLLARQGEVTCESHSIDGDCDACEWEQAAIKQLRAALSSSPEQAGSEAERIARKAFIAGGQFVDDSVFRDKRGNFHAASTESLVKAARDYSKEPS